MSGAQLKQDEVEKERARKSAVVSWHQTSKRGQRCVVAGVGLRSLAGPRIVRRQSPLLHEAVAIVEVTSLIQPVGELHGRPEHQDAAKNRSRSDQHLDNDRHEAEEGAELPVGSAAAALIPQQSPSPLLNG